MRLNYDCVRAILLHLENEIYYDGNDSITKGVSTTVTQHQILNNEGLLKKFSRQDLMYTLDNLYKAELITAIYQRGGSENAILLFIINGITEKGDDLLNTIRDDGVYKEIKSKVSKVAGASLNIFAQVAGTVGAEYTKKLLGLNGTT